MCSRSGEACFDRSVKPHSVGMLHELLYLKPARSRNAAVQLPAQGIS
jgi:hypothetical protein